MFGSSSGLFYNNVAYNNSGRGFHLYESGAGATIKNNISMSNSYGFSGITGASATHDYNCAYNNTTDNWDGVILIKQTHDIETDPISPTPLLTILHYNLILTVLMQELTHGEQAMGR